MHWPCFFPNSPHKTSAPPVRPAVARGLQFPPGTFLEPEKTGMFISSCPPGRLGKAYSQRTVADKNTKTFGHFFRREKFAEADRTTAPYSQLPRTLQVGLAQRQIPRPVIRPTLSRIPLTQQQKVSRRGANTLLVHDCLATKTEQRIRADN